MDMAASLVKRGALIVIEGVDRVGKTTQCQRLVKQLKADNLPAEYIRFPKRDTLIGQLIDKYLANSTQLDDHVIHLLFSANRWELVNQMKDKLLNGITLIVDRYAYSGVAYSAAKETLSLEWCKACDSGLLKPDLVIYLTASDDCLQSRPGFGDEVYETNEFQTRVKKVFERLREDYWKIQVADKSEDDLAKDILETAMKAIKCAEKEELQSLWTEVQAL